MAYRVTLQKRAVKALEKINEPVPFQHQGSYLQPGQRPRPIGCKKLKGRDGYRIRVADYRIIYDVFDDVLLVHVIGIGHRRDIYRES